MSAYEVDTKMYVCNDCGVVEIVHCRRHFLKIPDGWTSKVETLYDCGLTGYDDVDVRHYCSSCSSQK